MAGLDRLEALLDQRTRRGRILQFLLDWLIGYPLILLVCALTFGPPAIRRHIDKLIMSPQTFQSKYWIMPE